MLFTHGFLASGDIARSRFVTISGNFTVAQAAATSKVLGVSHDGSRRVPRSDGAADDALAAKSGEPCPVHGPGEVCLVELGGTVAAGDYVVPDANGKAVAEDPLATGNHRLGGMALEGGAVNELRRILLTPMLMDSP